MHVLSRWQRYRAGQKKTERGKLRDECHLDTSPEFSNFIDVCRRGDVHTAQELIEKGANVNGKDRSDNTPLIIASLCGHYELAVLLLESGAMAERDTFQGERCIYNALNDKMRKLLLKYDYAKRRDPLQPWAAYITKMLDGIRPDTSEITIVGGVESFRLYRFLLWARSPYFRQVLDQDPQTSTWTLPPSIPGESLHLVIRWLYLADVSAGLADVAADQATKDGTGATQEEIFAGVDNISKQLGIPRLWECVQSWQDGRQARQKQEDEVNLACGELAEFVHDKIIGGRMVVESSKVDDVKWTRENAVFADCILRADMDDECHLYPVHRAMLMRSEYFTTMFTGRFVEAQESEYLRILQPLTNCPPHVLEIIITFLYTEKAVFPVRYGLDVLFAADMLLMDSLKVKAVAAFSMLGCGNLAPGAAEEINVYDVIETGWLLGLQRLEDFGARYLAYRLEDYIDEPEFVQLIKKSVSRVQARHDDEFGDLINDIRFYIDERFRFCFEELSFHVGTGNGHDAAAHSTAVSLPAAVTLPSGPLWRPRGNVNKPSKMTETLDGQRVDNDPFLIDLVNKRYLLARIDKLLEKLGLKQDGQFA